MSLIVTLDGPSGTGKSTVSKAVAEIAELPHLDTGAFYRAATMAVLEAEVDPADSEGVMGVVSRITLDQDGGTTWLDGRNVSRAIRSEPVTRNVSAVSAHLDVRTRLVALQRSWVDRRAGRAVVEGRDIGSVVFPDADLKIYLDASPEVRAMRRSLQSGDDPSQVAEQIARRDLLDSTRESSPLTVPEGAIVVDTSDMTLEEVIDRIVGMISAKS